MPSRNTTRLLLSHLHALLSNSHAVQVSFLLLSFLASCTSQATPAVFTATPPVASATPATDTAPPDPSLPSETPSPPATLTPALGRAQYSLDLQLNYTARTAAVDQTILYPNWTGETLTSLVLAVVPNLWSGGFSLQSITVDDIPITNFILEPFSQRLEVQLPQPIPPGATAAITIRYSLVLPQMQAYLNASNDVRPQIYGHSDLQVNFVDWYPMVVPYQPGQGCVLHNPWYYGEHLTYDLADFDVTVTFTDGANPKVAASGAEIDPQPYIPTRTPTAAVTASVTNTPAPTSTGIVSRRFTLEAGRTFALSMSDHFKVAQQTVGDVTVFSYYFGLYDAPGEAMLQTTVEAMQTFSERFGPYRHKTLTAVQGDFNDGMEFSGLYFISRDYFNLYDGTPRNYLVAIAAHETAHQWWFDAVANDQALEPWLDEALSTYSEVIYYETIYPEVVEWWWNYRYFEFQQAGFVDTPIYDGGGQRPYWDKVYLTGARFFRDLRAQVGDEIFFTFLRNYYSQAVGKQVTSADFFRVFRETTAADITVLLVQYFKNTY